MIHFTSIFGLIFFFSSFIFLITDILANSKELEDVLKSLNQDGSHLWKVRSASKWFRRKFILDINEMAMKYEPSAKSACFQKQKKNSKSFTYFLIPTYYFQSLINIAIFICLFVFLHCTIKRIAFIFSSEIIKIKKSYLFNMQTCFNSL